MFSLKLYKNNYIIFFFVISIISIFFNLDFIHIGEYLHTIHPLHTKLDYNVEGNLAFSSFHFEQINGYKSWAQINIYFFISKILYFFNIKDHFVLYYVFRSFSVLVGLSAYICFFKFYLKEYDHGDIKNYKFIFLFFFIPLAISRLTPELLSFTIFLLSVCINEGKDYRYKNLISALLFALSFNLRYQNIIFYIFYFLWIIIIKKRPIKKQLIHLILFILFNILFYFLDVLENYKLNDLRNVNVAFEYYVPNFYVYLIQNLYGDIERYGTMPYYYYLVLITKHFYFPFGLFFLISFLICILINRNNILVWLCLPFFLIHSYIGHKELRFLFPILLLTPFFFIESYTFFKKYNNFLLKALFKFIVILNIIYFVILNFNFYSNRIALFKFIDHNYKTTDELYLVGGNPFVKSDIPFVFFMNDFPKIRLLNNSSIEGVRKDLLLKNIKSFNLLVTRGKITRGKKFTEFSNLNDFCHLQYSTLPLFLTKINIRVNTSYSLIYKCNNIN